MTNSSITDKEFAEIVRQYSRIINKVSYFYATEQMPFDDLRQEIYVNIWQALPRFRGESKISTWIYRVSVNSALMCIRSAKPKVKTVALDFGLPDVSLAIDGEQKENLRELYSLINRLESIEKAIILLWLDEYSYFQNPYTMQRENLKRSMSVLEQLLAKTSSDIEVNTAVSETAQSKILKKYRQAFTSCLVLAVVYGCLWLGNVTPEKLPVMYKAFIVILCTVGAGWYLFLFMKLKNIKVSTLTPVELIAKTTKIKLLTLSGEVFFGLVLTVFFTLLLSDMLVCNPLVFWLIVAVLFVGLIRLAVYVWPRYIRLFRDLNSIK